MPTDLRERLKALVEEWRVTVRKAQEVGFTPIAAASVRDCADQLAAILAESESDPHSSHGPESCWRCADAEVRREREASLPLGHPFEKCNWSPDCARCGQPRSAHEPKPFREPGK